MQKVDSRNKWNKEEIIKESSDKSSGQPKKKKEKLKTDGNGKKNINIMK